jgi:hypothetical protein
VRELSLVRSKLSWGRILWAAGEHHERITSCEAMAAKCWSYRMELISESMEMCVTGSLSMEKTVPSCFEKWKNRLM